MSPPTLQTTGPTTIHLVRHGTHALLSRLLPGRMPGVPLDPGGTAQANLLADRFAARLAEDPITAVISSPVQRALETAAPLANRLGLDIETDPGWEELDMGTWTGIGLDELHADPAWQAWNLMRGLAGCPGGETMHAVQSRALLALSRTRTRVGEGTAIVFTHSDVIKSVLAAVLGWPLENVHRLTVDPASVSTVVLFDSFVRVDGINR